MSKPNKRIVTTTSPETGEVCTGFIIGGYNDSYASYFRLVEQAKRDFPHLRNQDINLSKITKSRIMKDFIVVTFPVPRAEAKRAASYDQWTFHAFNW